jgi:integrase
MISAKTRSWKKAEKFAKDYEESLDPVQQELKRLRAQRERESVRIPDAVALYIADMIARLGDNGTVAMARSVFGHIDPETKNVKSSGLLFNWLDRLPITDRPTFIADIMPAHLTAWRATWKFGSDLTAANRWTMVKSFFLFCERQGWIQDSPARKLKSLEVAQGSRTAIFTDEQYDAILDAVPLYDPDNVPEATRKHMQQRLTTFIELLRWSGMAIVDGVLWRPELVDADGVLRYRRKKSDVLATVPLPAHVVAQLRDVPLERDSVGAHQPFRSKDTDIASDTATWSRRLGIIFDLAGIKQVKNERGRARKPHVHMLRDTFAVWHLRHGSRLHVVSKMLGHAKTTTTERAYLPWVKELEEAHIAEARRTLAAAAKPKQSKTKNVVSIARKQS